MAQDILDVAWKEIRRRRFSRAIKFLEGRYEIYENNARYYIMLGTAYLYLGDVGPASDFYQRARRLRLTDTQLLLGQAAIYLRRGNTERAISYYLDVMENDPGNKTAKDALEFIRDYGDYETICRWIDTGKIQQFYPPIGANPDKFLYIVVAFMALFSGILFTFAFLRRPVDTQHGPRMDLSSIVLTVDERAASLDNDLSEQSYRYTMSNNDVTKSYEKALGYFQKNDDNRAQIEINRILNSNATFSIKQKARVLMGYLSVPTFDTLVFSPAFRDVEKDPELYLDCYVIWGGRISDVEATETSFSCRFLIGYETMKNIEGIVDLSFDSVPIIESDKPLKVLAKISSENGKMVLKGHAVYQSVNF